MTAAQRKPDLQQRIDMAVDAAGEISSIAMFLQTTFQSAETELALVRGLAIRLEHLATVVFYLANNDPLDEPLDLLRGPEATRQEAA